MVMLLVINNVQIGHHHLRRRVAQLYLLFSDPAVVANFVSDQMKQPGYHGYRTRHERCRMEGLHVTQDFFF